MVADRVGTLDFPAGLTASVVQHQFQLGSGRTVDRAEVGLARADGEVRPNEAGQVEVDRNRRGPVDHQDEPRRLVTGEPAGIDRRFDDRLRTGRNVAGADADVGAAALRIPRRDVDFLVRGIQNAERVADLRALGHRSEVVRSVWENRVRPVGCRNSLDLNEEDSRRQG